MSWGGNLVSDGGEGGGLKIVGGGRGFNYVWFVVRVVRVIGKS